MRRALGLLAKKSGLYQPSWVPTQTSRLGALEAVFPYMKEGRNGKASVAEAERKKARRVGFLMIGFFG